MAGNFVRIDGLKDTLRALDDLGGKLRGRVLRKALQASQKPLVQAARARVPVRTRTLRKSLGAKVKIYREGHGVAVTGPRVSIVGEYRGRKVRPAKYAHLVEHGTVRAAAHPFLEPASQSSQGAMLTAMTRVIQGELARLGGKQ